MTPTSPSAGVAAPDYVPGPLDLSAPPRVWLQVDTAGDNSDRSEAMPRDAWDQLSWCYESIGGQEVEYVRADLAALGGGAPAKEGERCESVRVGFTQQGDPIYANVPVATPAAPKGGEGSELSDWPQFRERRIALFKLWSGVPLEEVEKARNAYLASEQPATPTAPKGGEGDAWKIDRHDRFQKWAQELGYDGIASALTALERPATPAGGGDDDVALIAAILKGYPDSIAKVDGLAACSRLASTGSAPAPSAWRPIGSAPKDGTYILLSQRWLRDQPFIGWWMAGKWRVDTRSYDTSGDAIVIENIGAQSDIDYWQPLPAAPTQEPQP